MNARRAVLTVSMMMLLAMAGCGEESGRSQEPLEDVSVDEQMSPASENRPAEIGRDDTTPTPGTRPTTTEKPEDQTEQRDRLPPDG